jgi:type I restriction enzyme R subunit
MLGNLFDPKAELFIHDRLRPHWAQAGAIVFITARTKDSIPHDVLMQWEHEKKEWIDRLALQHDRPMLQRLNTKDAVAELSDHDRQEFLKHFNRKREMALDLCHGECWLRKPDLAKIVADSLLHFDGIRYRMGDFIVMPNHFHALAAFADPDSMEKQFDSWLHWTATQINRKINRRGHFWQQEPFDHLVRSIEQYEYLRQYIADNPKKAKLREGEYYYHSR